MFILYFQAYQKTIDRLEKELKQAKAAVSRQKPKIFLVFPKSKTLTMIPPLIYTDPRR